MLKCAKHYDTKECGYNSKERLAYHLFRKIIHAYLIFFIRDFVYHGLEILVPSRLSFKFRIERFDSKKAPLYNLEPENAHNNVTSVVKIFNKRAVTQYNVMLIPSNKLRKLIVDAHKKGTRYNNLKFA